MSSPLPFFGREEELQLIWQRWRATTGGRGANAITFVAETGVGKSRIIQQFYQQLTVDQQWDPHHFWPDDFQTHATQLRVNPEFPADYIAGGAPKFIWLGVRWSNHNERNVANSLALPTLKEQLSSIAEQVALVQPRQQRVIDALKADALTIAKEVASGQVEEYIDGVVSSFFPYYRIIKTAFDMAEQTRGVLGLRHTPPTLADQLHEVFGQWFAQKNPLPIVLWLDDVQWIDAESRQFFARLLYTAHEQHWPLLCLATCWPLEWRSFSDDFFLKRRPLDSTSAWPWVVVRELADANTQQLYQLIHAALPNLPREQQALIIEKAGGNFLTMIENIAELLSKPRYFVDQDRTKALSPLGLERITTWQSTRHIRITQRFNDEFDGEVQAFLARASHAGIDTHFLRQVLLRFARTHPHVGDIGQTLQRCQDVLALVVPLSANLHEFRDRGYFHVARTYFDEWLAPHEAAALQHALSEELNERIQHLFDGHVHGDGTTADHAHHTPSSREQYTILRLAHQFFGATSARAVQTLVAFCRYCLAHVAWHELRTIEPMLAPIDWRAHVDTAIGWDDLAVVANACHVAGLAHAIPLYQLLLDHAQARNDATPVTDQRHTRIELHRLLAACYDRQGNHADCYHHLVTARTLLVHQYAEAPQPDTERMLAVTLHDLAVIARISGTPPEAVALLDDAVAHATALVTTQQTIADYRLYVSVLNTVADGQLMHGDMQGARTTLNKLLPSLAYLAAHGNATDVRSIAATQARLGYLAYTNGEMTTARDLYQRHLDELTAIATISGAPNDIEQVMECHGMLGRIYHRLGDDERAINHHEEAVRQARRIVATRGNAEDRTHLSTALSDLGDIYLARSDHRQAQNLYRESLTHMRHAYTTHPMATTQYGLAFALITVAATESPDMAWTHTTEARTLANDLIALRGTPDDYRLLCSILIHIAEHHALRDERTDACTAIDEAVHIAERLHTMHPDTDSAELLANTRLIAANYHAPHTQRSPASSSVNSRPWDAINTHRILLIGTLMLIVIIWRLVMG